MRATTTTSVGTGRRFLLLQGPHGPFFGQLARRLQRAGASVLRVGFNGGDRLFWPRALPYVAFPGPLEDWPRFLERLCTDQGITDILLYGEVRPVHAQALALARLTGIGTHILEEGYLRPWWVTYERAGANGNSPLRSLSVSEMAAALEHPSPPPGEVPALWGALRQHMALGALYHAAVLAGGTRIAPHRNISVWREFRLHLRRLILLPLHAAERVVTTRRILVGGFPYHLVLLQLDHDASFRAHRDVASTVDFVETVLAAFAEGAPPHHHLVFKAHPLEDGRVPLAELIADAARRHGIIDRIHYVTGGKLAPLLDAARSAVTVNSTSAEQALWRGLPVRPFGKAVYDKPEFVSFQPLEDFFSSPEPPDRDAYAVYRAFLLSTSQVSGSYYAARGRRQLLRSLPDLLLDPMDRYARLSAAATHRQHLSLVGASAR